MENQKHSEMDHEFNDKKLWWYTEQDGWDAKEQKIKRLCMIIHSKTKPPELTDG